MPAMAGTSPLELSDEVAVAVREGAPVVALESTIITHGMPYPTNVETAIAVEEEVVAGGATPATIALDSGRLRVGLERADLDRLGRAEGAVKVSRRDIAYSVHTGATGGTTVAATMLIAELAGIRVFATGGIGGVHRGAQHTFDVSADLQELARTPVTVVSAGFKSILDLDLTLEYLETMGVPVVGFRTSTLPAFFARTSGHRLDQRVERAGDVAKMMLIDEAIGRRGGMVVANPVPEDHAMDPSTIDGAIDRAVSEADARGIAGKELTPWLLARVTELTDADSLEANVALVRNNASVAAEIAVALASIRRSGEDPADSVG